jgi:two-component system, LuxR family, sensor kinase FixL
MIEQAQTVRPTPVPFPRILSLPKTALGLGYLAGYLLLDWVSFIEPYAPFGITPWNPGTGLSFALVLLSGRRMIPFLFVSPLLSDIVHQQLPMPWPVELACTFLIGGGYSAALMLLLRPRTRFDPSLSSMRDLILLMLVAVVSAAFVASSYVGVTIAAGLLPTEDFAAAALRYWVGDVIGIIVVTPFVLMASMRRRILRMSAETALQLAAIIGALALVFGYAEERQFQLFYVLLLPIVWMAVRTGSEGVTVGILVTQLGLILGVMLVPEQAHDVTAFQALMLVLATTGLVAGELVTERRRTESQLRLHQESLSRLARLGSMGELAAAVAHELNQPLMAAGTYTRLVDDAMRSGNTNAAAVAETARKAVVQVERAAEVVRRLRALVRLDRSSRAPCSVERIVKETLDLCQPDLDRIHAGVRSTLANDLPPVMVDILQIEQAVLNLVRNSIEAIGEAGQINGAISIEAAVAGADFVEIRVSDTGPGFPTDLVDNPFLPFSSTKPEGLGFGLPLCKSIVEAHGGRLWLHDAARGASVHFTLPVAKASHYG